MSKCLFSVLLLGLALGPRAQAGERAKPKRPVIQMAILLDTSSSMSGLIDQAKSQLWKVVNEFTASRRNGLRPDIEVALFEYGKSSLAREGGYIRMISPLTTDLDKISEELFALRTNGGDEYCGQVIDQATRDLAWSKGQDDLRVIFIAGNEPFTQGPVDFRKACRAAIARGITVNTIHCGSEADGVSGKWKDGALLADGSYLNIDHNRKVEHIAAPQDAEIARLGAALNETYVPFGRVGVEGQARQAAQDSNAVSSAGGSMMNRAVFKSSANYSNPSWDLVDAVEGGAVDLDELEDAKMPEALKGKNAAERKAYLDGKRAERSAIQSKIRALDEERKKYVAQKRREKSAQTEEDTLDAAMIKSVRSQAARKKFVFGSDAQP